MKKIKSNSGFTLVELIICMAILAFLMLSVSSIMSSSVASNRKAKADITVQTTAQQIYNQLTDSIMQANEIVILGYAVTGDVDFTLTDKDDVISGTTAKLNYYVKDKAQADRLIANANNAYLLDGSGLPTPSATNIKYFSSLKETDKLYAVRIIADVSKEVDLTCVTSQSTVGTSVRVKDLFTIGDNYDINTETSAAGNDVLDTKDTQRNVFTFVGNKLYYERNYRFMDVLNDTITDWSGSSSSMRGCLFSESFDSVKIPYNGSDVALSGCLVTVDAQNEGISLSLIFDDKNMTYTTLGMVNTRNSYVIKARKNTGLGGSSEGVSSEENSSEENSSEDSSSEDGSTTEGESPSPSESE